MTAGEELWTEACVAVEELRGLVAVVGLALTVAVLEARLAKSPVKAIPIAPA